MGHKALFETEKISEYQGSQEMKMACFQVELELRIGELDRLYHPYLDTISDTLFKEDLNYQRNWFLIVRQAQENKKNQIIFMRTFSQNAKPQEHGPN